MQDDGEFENFDEEDIAGGGGGEPSSKRRNVARDSDETKDADPSLWNIAKVKFYKQDPKVPGRQQLWPANSDDQVKIEQDGCMVSNAGGYRCARSAYGLSEGCSYFEVIVPADGCVRAGWATERADPEANVGYDAWSYGVRSSDGAKFHQSRGRSYCPGGGFNPGDVMGLYIWLAPRPPDEPEPAAPKPAPELPVAVVVGETEDHWQVRVPPGGGPCALPTSDVVPVARPLSQWGVFRNGQWCGVAHDALHSGTYYCAVSPYRAARVEVNFGPEWKYPPQIPEGFPKPTPASELHSLLPQ